MKVSSALAEETLLNDFNLEVLGVRRNEAAEVGLEIPIGGCGIQYHSGHAIVFHHQTLKTRIKGQ